MRGRALVVAVALIAAVGRPAASPVATLSPKDIADAIQLGNFGEPRPYALRARSADPNKRNPVDLGSIYTPFVRVALAARAARDAGHVLSPDDVDPKLLEPVVHIAFHWFVKDREHPDSDYAPSQTYWIFKRDIDWSGLPRPANGVDPTSVKRGAEAAALLAAFGAEPPDHTVLVATFPIEALRTDGLFVIYRKFLRQPTTPPYPVQVLTEGEILPDELARWK
jgi:hypothetical protein